MLHTAEDYIASIKSQEGMTYHGAELIMTGRGQPLNRR